MTNEEALQILTSNYISDRSFEAREVIKKAINRLTELEDKIEKGRLMELPCKVGDTVYLSYISSQRHPFTYIVSRITAYIDKDETKVYAYDQYDRGGKLGAILFTTLKEAEAKLKELGENTDERL